MADPHRTTRTGEKQTQETEKISGIEKHRKDGGKD